MTHLRSDKNQEKSPRMWCAPPAAPVSPSTSPNGETSNVHQTSQSMQVTEDPGNGEFQMTSVGLEDEDPRGAGENGFGADVTAAERDERYPAGNSSAAGAVANFVNTIVGAGIVGLPFALAQVCAEVPIVLSAYLALTKASQNIPYFFYSESRNHVRHPVSDPSAVADEISPTGEAVVIFQRSVASDTSSARPACDIVSNRKLVCNTARSFSFCGVGGPTGLGFEGNRCEARFQTAGFHQTSKHTCAVLPRTALSRNRVLLVAAAEAEKCVELQLARLLARLYAVGFVLTSRRHTGGGFRQCTEPPACVHLLAVASRNVRAF